MDIAEVEACQRAVGGDFDINDMVFLANPELRVKSTVVPNNALYRASLIYPR